MTNFSESGLKILVVEDEIIIADNICMTLEDLGYAVLEPVITYDQAINSIEQHSPDFVILDIQLAGEKDGVDLAEKLKTHYNLPFIFLTSNSDVRTIERVKKLNPPAFLVKPFRKDDLFSSIEIAVYNFAQSQKVENPTPVIKDALFVKNNGVFDKVRFDDIRYVKSDHVYMEIYTSKGRHVFRDSFKNLMTLLPDYFFKTHKSYAVNLNYLESIKQDSVVIDGNEIPLSKGVKGDLMSSIQKK